MTMFNLTSREMEILERLARGWSNKRIAIDLDIEPNTVRVHLSNIYPKMNVHNRFEAIVRYNNEIKLLGYSTI